MLKKQRSMLHFLTCGQDCAHLAEEVFYKYLFPNIFLLLHKHQLVESGTDKIFFSRDLNSYPSTLTTAMFFLFLFSYSNLIYLYDLFSIIAIFIKIIILFFLMIT